MTATLAGDGRADGARGLSGRRRRRAQRGAQGPGPDVRGRRRSRSSTCSATSRWTGRCRAATACGRCTRPTARPTICWCASRCPGRGRYRMSMLVPDELASAAGRRRGRARVRGRAQTGAAPHPGGARPAGPGADHGAQPALVVGVPDQPPHRRRLRPRPGVRRRRRRPHPSAHRRAGHEHRHPGRPQPGVEARARASAARPPPACWTATTPSAGPVGEEVVGRTVRSAREGIGADSTDLDYVIRREAQLLIDYADSPHRRTSAARWRARAPDATGLTRAAVTGPAAAVLAARQARAHHAAVRGRRRRPADVATYSRRGRRRQPSRPPTGGWMSI